MVQNINHRRTKGKLKVRCQVSAAGFYGHAKEDLISPRGMAELLKEVSAV
jgi:hypothetical protein